MYTSILLFRYKMTEQTGDPYEKQQYKTSKYVVSMSWRQNVICENLVHHLPVTISARSPIGLTHKTLCPQQIPLIMMRPVA